MPELRPIFDAWRAAAIEFLPRLILIAVILLITRLLGRYVQSWITHAAARTKAPPEIGVLLGRIVWVLIVLAGGLLVLQQLGWDQAVIGFTASLGVAGLLAGFALQDIVRQFAAGVLLLMLRPFRVGDTIKVGEYTGTVVDVQLRVTILKTENGDEVLIPNADVYNHAIINHSRYQLRRRVLTLKLPRSADLGAARTRLHQALSTLPAVVAEPPVDIAVTVVDETGTTLELRLWIDERHPAAASVATQALAAAEAVLGEVKGEE